MSAQPGPGSDGMAPDMSQMSGNVGAVSSPPAVYGRPEGMPLYGRPQMMPQDAHSMQAVPTTYLDVRGPPAALQQAPEAPIAHTNPALPVFSSHPLSASPPSSVPYPAHSVTFLQTSAPAPAAAPEAPETLPHSHPAPVSYPSGPVQPAPGVSGGAVAGPSSSAFSGFDAGRSGPLPMPVRPPLPAQAAPGGSSGPTPTSAAGLPPEELARRLEYAENENRMLRAKVEKQSQLLQNFQNRIALAEAQCQTHWELLCRIHDLIIVFDLAGIVVFVSPVCEQLLQYKPEELFNRPLANVLAEEFHAEFEENVRRMMNMQQRRPLAGDELVTRNKFVRKDGSKVWMEGKGQAWQRDDVVEFVMVYRERSQPPHTDAPSGTAAPGEPAKRTAPAPAPAGPPMNGASQYVPPMAGPLAALSAVAAASNYGGMQGPPEGMPPQMAPQSVAGGMAPQQLTPQQYQQLLAAQAYMQNGGMPMQGGMYGMPPRGPPPPGGPGPAPGAH